MGWFTKKETTHFERDEAGKVVRTTRNGEDVTREVRKPKWKSEKQLMQEYYEKHPEKKHPTLKRIGGGLAKLDKKVVKYNQGKNIMSSGYHPSRKSPAHDNYNPFGNLFDTGMSRPKTVKKQSKTTAKYAVVGGKAYPIADSGKKKKGKKKSKSKASFGFGGFDSMDSMGFFK